MSQIRLDAQLQQEYWNNKLVDDSLTRDIMVGFAGVYNDKTQELPESVFFNASGQANPGSNSVTVGLLLALNNAPITGRTSMLGNEELQVVKYVQLFSNEVKNAVNTERYGIDAFRKNPYGIIGKVQPQLSKWHDEIRGLYYREALCEKYSSNLTVAPTNGTCVQHINSNVFIAGVAKASQPAYESTLAGAGYYMSNIDDAIPGTTTATHQASITVLNAIADWAINTKEIEPIMIDGKPMYILTIPSNQAIKLRDPSSGTALAGIAVNADVRGKGNQAYTTYLGDFGPLRLIEDSRYPKADVSTDSVTFGYKGAGSTDNRSADAAATVWDVGFLLGKGCVGKYEMEALHFEDEIQDYQRNQGVGAFANYGVQLMEFDQTTPSDTSRHNKSSAIILFASALS